ncbi:LysR family transcriptional regulator [Pseudogracilibacillus auburnensis]|uniref:LysR family transcriptional regulator n=1 Tax=Pseudogracilibacillus auburnensis TaxID=1494959 RepID=UPI001A95AB3F|nr:LysR family transcriptional regulator [Pseudogracilibacillus auburnensis]MBO1001159.1 LysR family transcriptional regulator [Pseudogracilibacillus auburnensis]
MDIKDLVILKSVAKNKSISKASDELNYVQSNITRSVNKLEDELGTKLFIRHSRGVTMTNSGQTLLSYANQIIHLLEESKRVITSGTEVAGPLRIGATDITISIRLPEVISLFSEKYPKVDLSLNTGYTTDLVQSVLEYELDGAFVTDPVVHKNIESIPLIDEKIMLISKSDNDFSSFQNLNEEKLLVFGEGCTYRKKTEKYLEDTGITPHKKIEFNSFEGLIGCVKAGLGVGVVSKRIVEIIDTSFIDCIELPKEYSRVQTVFIKRNDSADFKALTSFLTIAKKLFH